MTLVCTVCLASKNNTNRNTKIAFHKLPKKPQLRSMWLKALNMTEETVSKFTDFRVCSRHFKDEEYVEKNDSFWHLKPGVVPSMKLPKKVDYVLPETFVKPVADSGSDSNVVKTGETSAVSSSMNVDPSPNIVPAATPIKRILPTSQNVSSGLLQGKNVVAPPPINPPRFMVQNVSGQTLPSEQVPLPVLSLIQKLATEGVGFPMIIQQEPNTQVTADNQPNSTTSKTTVQTNIPKLSTGAGQHSNSQVVFKNVKKLISTAVEIIQASAFPPQKEGIKNASEQPKSQSIQCASNNLSASNPVIAQRKIEYLGLRDFKDIFSTARTVALIKTQIGRQRFKIQKANERYTRLRRRLSDLRSRLRRAKLQSSLKIDENGDIEMKD